MIKCTDCKNLTQFTLDGRCNPCHKLHEQSFRSPARGLKDHEISELVNAVRDAVAPITQHQCSRELISRAVVNYLKSNGLKIDSV